VGPDRAGRDDSRLPGSTLRTVVNYHAYDDAWVPDVLAGKTKEEVGDKHDGDLLGDHPKLTSRASSRRRCWRCGDSLNPTVSCTSATATSRRASTSSTSPVSAACARTTREVHRRRTTLPDDLVQGLWDEITPEAEQWREIGVYGPAVTVPRGRAAAGRLLGLTGRQPR